MKAHRVLDALVAVQAEVEVTSARRDVLVAAARAAGATWEEVAIATRCSQSTAWARWGSDRPRRARVASAGRGDSRDRRKVLAEARRAARWSPPAAAAGGGVLPAGSAVPGSPAA